ncbi:MAG: type transport system ATP-binding protein [Pseudonocardiales bacterium]|nr:type transport system ATP-binding protein [Pseudonocardiales bacterium]
MNGRGNNDGSGRIVVRNLTKRFGPVEAVRDLSFTVEPGQVTGFLGPNGAGKTTTLRAALGLLTPTDGEVTVNGVRYEQLGSPAKVVGALLDSNAFHHSRRARAHLRIYTAAIGVPDQRADEVLALVGLTDAANRKIGGFSLGMRQRLALATALLGDPRILILDEPGSGLDPEGVAWLRGFMRSFAGSGRTVLVSSHQLAEVAQTVDQVVIISQGARVFEGKLDQLRGDAQERVQVRCSDPTRLATALAEHGVTDIQSSPDDGLTIIGATSVTVGDVALAAGVAIYRMAQERTDLEQQFLQLTTAQYQPRGPYAQPGYLPAQPGAFGPPAQPPGAYGPPAQPPGAFGPPAQQPGAYGPPAQLPNQEGPR